MMFCGAGSFKDVDKEEIAGGGKPATAAAKAMKKASSKTKGKDNPYAYRGLDKFSTVLSELESKKERILRRVGPDVDADHLMVRFVQSEAKGWVPIVVKVPHEEEQATAGAKKRKSKPGKPSSSGSSTPSTEPASPKEDPANKPTHVAAAVGKAAAVPAKKSKPSGVRWSWAWGKKLRPYHYWPLAMALLLLSLVVFGRVFAICCTSIWWYLLPILSGEEGLCTSTTTASTATKARKNVGFKAGDKLAVAAPPSHGKKSSSGSAHEVVSNQVHRKKG